MRYPAYPKYKASGIEWLGDVPEHWEAVPLKHVTDFVNGMAVKPEEWSDEGIPIIRIENLNGGTDFNHFDGDVDRRYHVSKGDLLFGWSGNRGTSFGPFRWRRDGLHYLNQHIFRLTGFKCDSSWLYWCLKAVTKTIEDEAHGIIGMVHVTKGKLGAIKIPRVPHSEQCVIADFLNVQTARLEMLAAKKLALIEKLTEKRTALISRTITRGLPPDAARGAGLEPHPKLKPSGIDWLGDIPEHWAVKRFRHLISRLDQGWSPNADSSPAEEDQWGVLKLSAARDGRFVPSENKALDEVPDGVSLVTPEKDDLLISRSNTPERVGDACLVLQDCQRLIVPDLLYRVKLLPGKAVPAYVCAFLLSRGARAQIEADARGSSGSMVKLGQGHLLSWFIPCPPLPEQRIIAEFLDRELAKINQMIAKVETVIERLQEYRTALITAAVTGKIDVREVAT